MKDNISRSIDRMQEETDYFQMLYNNRYFQLDNWTEATILNFIYNNYEDSAIRTAFAQKEGYALFEGRAVETSVEALASIVDSEVLWEYTRSAYWLGGRAILIGMLHFMNYQQIRVVLTGIGYCLFFTMLMVIARKISLEIAMIIAGGFLMVNFQYGLMNMTLGMFCFWIIFVSIIYLSYCKKVDCFYFLFVVGLLTQYLEWFALSITTFGVITLYMLLIEWEKNRSISFVRIFNLIFNAALGWIVGFCLMFFGRMIGSTLVEGEEAIKYIFSRVSDDIVMEEKNAFEGIVNANLSCLQGIFPVSITNLDNNTIMIISAIGVIVLLMALLFCKDKRAIFTGCLIISLAPIVWISVLSSYCVNHYWILYRVLCVSLCSVLFVIVELIKSIISCIKKNPV